jgi:hypothetical protein
MPRQRDDIIRRGTTFAVKYRNPAGKQKWESDFANRSQAQQRLNQVLGEITHGSYVEPKGTKFEKFANEWMDGRVGVRGSSTEPSYEFIQGINGEIRNAESDRSLGVRRRETFGVTRIVPYYRTVKEVGAETSE